MKKRRARAWFKDRREGNRRVRRARGQIWFTARAASRRSQGQPPVQCQANIEEEENNFLMALGLAVGARLRA